MMFKTMSTIIANQENKTLIVLNDMTAVIMANKKIEAIAKEIIRFRKLNVSLAFIIHFFCSKRR